MALNKLPKRFHIDFKKPRVAPKGDVEIDWSNPLTRGLSVFTLFNADAGKGVHELVAKKPHDAGTFNVNNVGYIRAKDAVGKHIRSISTEQDQLRLHGNRAIPSGRDTTILTGANYNSGSVDHTLIHLGNAIAADNSPLIWADTSGGVLRASWTSASAANFHATSKNIPVGQFTVWGFTFTAASSTFVRAYVDGEDVGSGSQGVTDGITSRIWRYANDSGGARQVDGQIYFYAVWDRELSAAENKAFSADPYQILKPLSPPMYFTAAAAAAANRSPRILPKRFHPDFSNLRRKPIGSVKLDATHPLRPDVLAYLLGDEIEARNLVPGTPPAVRLGTNAITKTAKSTGKALDFVNTHGDTDSAGARLRLTTMGVRTSGYLLCEFYMDTIAAGFAYMFAHSNNPVGSRLYIRVINGKISSRIGNATTHESVGTFVANERMVVLLAWSGGNLSMYINGELDSTSTFTGNPGSSTAVTMLGQFDDNSTRLGAFDGKVLSVFLGSTRPTDEQAISLTRNPYQLLEPLTPPMYFTAAAAAANISPRILPKRFHPDFSNPKVKPIGPVEIDLDNPLSRGLVGGWLMNSGGEFELDRSPTKSKAIFRNSAVRSVSSVGKIIDFGASNAELRVSPKPSQLNIIGDITIVQLVRFNSLTGEQFLIGSDFASEGDTSQNCDYSLAKTVTTNKLKMFWEHGTGANENPESTVALSINAGDWHTLACTREVAATSTVRFYKDGAKLGADVTGRTNALGGDASPLFIGGLREATTSQLNGDLGFTYIFNRVLSDDEIRSLTQSPYQIFKPLTPPMYFVGAGEAPAPSGRIMFSLANNGGLAGLGGIAGFGGGLAG